MNINLVKVGRIYRYEFSDDEVLCCRDIVMLSQDLEFCAECLVFSATRLLINEFKAEGRALMYSKNKGNKAVLHVELLNPVLVKFIRCGEVTAGGLLHSEFKRRWLVVNGKNGKGLVVFSEER